MASSPSEPGFLSTELHRVCGVYRESGGSKTLQETAILTLHQTQKLLRIGCRGWSIICISSTLVQVDSPFLHWNTLLRLVGHHCQIEGLGRSHSSQGMYLYSATARVQAASSPWSQMGAKHLHAFCLLRKVIWIWECEQSKEVGKWAGGSWEHTAFCPTANTLDVETARFYHFWCNSKERRKSIANRWGQETLALRSVP